MQMYRFVNGVSLYRSKYHALNTAVMINIEHYYLLDVKDIVEYILALIDYYDSFYFHMLLFLLLLQLLSPVLLLLLHAAAGYQSKSHLIYPRIFTLLLLFLSLLLLLLLSLLLLLFLLLYVFSSFFVGFCSRGCSLLLFFVCVVDAAFKIVYVFAFTVRSL